MKVIYIKYGSEDTHVGLFVDKVIINEGQSFSGDYTIISENEYNSILDRIKDPNSYLTDLGGLLSEKGKKIYDEMEFDIQNKEKEIRIKHISYFVRRFSKEIELGLIDKNDLAMAIDYDNNAKEFKDEIISIIEGE